MNGAKTREKPLGLLRFRNVIRVRAPSTDSQRPRSCATKANRDPTASGGGVLHSIALMLTYHSGAFAGSLA